MRWFLYSLVLLLFAPAAFAEESPASIPITSAKANVARRNYTIMLERIEAEHTKRLTEARAAYVQQLGEAMDEVMAARDLEQANAIDALRKEAQAEVTSASSPGEGGSALYRRLCNTTWIEPKTKSPLRFLPNGLAQVGKNDLRSWCVVGDQAFTVYVDNKGISHAHFWKFDPSGTVASLQAFRPGPERYTYRLAK